MIWFFTDPPIKKVSDRDLEVLINNQRMYARQDTGKCWVLGDGREIHHLDVLRDLQEMRKKHDVATLTDPD